MASATRARGRPAGAVVVASGGCTALTLASRFPDGEVTAFDLSPVQLAHARAKEDAILREDWPALGLDIEEPFSLLQCGSFEGLFRTLRKFVVEFVATRDDMLRFFTELREEASARRSLAEGWFASPYWPVAFELALHERLLHAMFGPEATMHAAPGSYPSYFRAAFERALLSAAAARNPFLQHVLLGRYVAEDAPAYLGAKAFGPITWIQGSLPDVPDLARYDVVSLSNVFDWSDDAVVASWAEALGATAPGTTVLVRFLNNQRDVAPAFAPRFRRDDALSRSLLDADRSFFYERVEVFVRT